jgi:hypothetical protein
MILGDRAIINTGLPNFYRMTDTSFGVVTLIQCLRVFPEKSSVMIILKSFHFKVRSPMA